MPRAPRAVIVGAGLMGRWHAHACRRVGGDVVAIVDLDDSAAGRLAAAHGARPARALLELPSALDFDIVHVCTPLPTHDAQIRAAIERRRPVLVEKPLAATGAATETLLAEAARAGVWIQPVHQTVYQIGVRRSMAWAAGGTVRVFDYVACSAGADAALDRADDVVLDILPHPLSLLDRLRPGVLDQARWTVYRPSPGELHATAVVDSISVRILISMHARPTRHDLTLLGDAGTATCDLFHGFAWRQGGRATRTGKIARPFVASAAAFSAAAFNLGRRAATREPAYPGLTALVHHVYRALDDPERRPFSDEHILAVARARDRIWSTTPHD